MAAPGRATVTANRLKNGRLCSKTNPHDGYIDWAEFDRNQTQLALNNYAKVEARKSGRGGRALLAGMLSCGGAEPPLDGELLGSSAGTAGLSVRSPRT